MRHSTDLTATTNLDASDFIDYTTRINKKVVFSLFQSYLYFGDPVSSQGTCQVILIIYKPSYQGHMGALYPQKKNGHESECYQWIYYALCPPILNEKGQSYPLQTHGPCLSNKQISSSILSPAFHPISLGANSIAI